MMSQHLNSMLEHLKMGSLIKTRPSSNENDSILQNNDKTDHLTNTIDTKDCNNGEVANDKTKTETMLANNHIIAKINRSSSVEQQHQHHKSNEQIYNSSLTPNKNANHLNNHTTNDTKSTIDLSKFDPRKRYSVSVGHSNGTVRELSPSNGRSGYRKLSQDIRLKGTASSLLDSDDMSIGKPTTVIKPMKLKSMLTKAETYDTMHCKALESMGCTREVCMGSIVSQQLVGIEVRKPDAVLQNAKDFLDQYYSSIRRLKSPAHETRWEQIQKEVNANGAYQLTETELIYGAKLAWRNSARCIGRIQWSKLQVFDCRYVTTTSGMFEAICNHIKYATNKGNLRSAITIFPQRTDGKHDYRIWNSQLISYAGYKNPDGSITGDPISIEMTDLCIKLGWRSKRTEWDILPMVLSANGHDPDYFEYPTDFILEVPLTHPTFTWFSEFNLRWYALPAVSGMLFDCGGVQFTGTAFSGWYMSTEIGCRNLCDTNRRNILEPVAIKMGLDTRNPTSLWKDKALVEINIAVLHSFQAKNITIVDHHTASESFMKHCENEYKLRNGCPADWIWIVPPMSASTTQVFHQEMALYNLKPSFDYQDSPLKTHIWKKGRDSVKNKKPRRKFHFKQIARAVKFTSKLFGRALSRRIKATVLYATETGRSEQYAKQLVELLGHAFNAQVYCMTDYDISSIEHEALLLVVASTFGNGDPPENGESFAQDLYAMKLHESGDHSTNDLRIAASSKSFIKANSRSDLGRQLSFQNKKIDRLDSLRNSMTDTLSEDTFGPLSNVRFAVFALGSSAYPNFCAYGKYIDNILGELGGERIMKLSTGDEMCGQEQAFRKWAPEVFKIACDTFCLDSDETFTDASFALQCESLTEDCVRFAPSTEFESLDRALAKFHNKKVKTCYAKEGPIDLHGEPNGSERSTMLIKILANNIYYEPGDHVGIFPANRKEIVDGVIDRLTGIENPDEISQLEVLKEHQTSNGVYKSWEPHEKLPTCSVRTLLTRFLDITTPPSRQQLTFLATYCEDKNEKERLTMLANESSVYEDWRYWKLPHLLEVLEEFPSCKPPATILMAQLMPLQPRFYSISSSPRKYRNEIHLTVAAVTYKSEDGEGPEHYGVCSNYLKDLQNNESMHLFVRSAQSFHIPSNPTNPVILIGPGTGIAPFRSFWQQWESFKLENNEAKIPKVWLFFGCRMKSLDLYQDEKNEMLEKGVLNKVFLALSREDGVQKTYVQDVALKEAHSVYNVIVKERGHIYVCGDVTMAENVYQTLRKIIAERENKTESEVEKFMLRLRDENRYHEDIFGITLRTAEIHNKSRASARIRMASQP